MHRMKSHSANGGAHAGAHHKGAENMHYLHLAIMVVLHFMAMYALMYAMVDTADHIYPNLNQLYMAGLMTSPMLLIELALMGGMYAKKRLNLAILALAAIAMAGCFLFIRAQTAIDDSEFLKSMIPHHSGAILMCQEASITDQRIVDLCGQIISGQAEEIRMMQGILQSME
jgi:uncharacterized protein (DUF305 family)